MKRRGTAALVWVASAVAAISMGAHGATRFAAAAEPLWVKRGVEIVPDVFKGHFGSSVFVPSFLQPPRPDPTLAPIWTPVPFCGQTAGPAEVYADDPETWTYSPIARPSGTPYPSTWTYTNPGQPRKTVKSMLMEKGGLNGAVPGLIYWFFDNELNVPARLYVGGISSSGGSVSFKYQVSNSIRVGGGVLDGAVETAGFLKQFVPGTTFSTKSFGGGPLPSPVVTYTVPNHAIVQGEMYITALSGGATVFVYADDCSGTPCPGIANVNLAGDKLGRRGAFVDAKYMIHHDFTAALEKGSGGFSWLDVVSPSSCVPGIAGHDPVDGDIAAVNAGDYGIPIVITGRPNGGGGGTEFSQFWFMGPSPAGQNPGSQAAYGVYLQGLNDPATNVDVTGGWAVAFPISAPPTPSPQPSPTPLVCCSTGSAAVLGLNHLATTRFITWIPSGDDIMPARFWYEVPPVGRHAVKAGVRTH